MIETITWDSLFFKKKIGRLVIKDEPTKKIKEAIEQAKDEGFAYITCSLPSWNINYSRELEAAGFYLSDIGITLKKYIKSPIYRSPENASTQIRSAHQEDIPTIQSFIKGIFTDSRFYNDPFFSKEDADAVFNTWIESSVNGTSADIVFYIPEKGFISCKKQSSETGQIVLIGVASPYRRKGFGKLLISKALGWFYEEGISIVSVRTQIRNIRAINFYQDLGFHIEQYDIVFSKILF